MPPTRAQRRERKAAVAKRRWGARRKEGSQAETGSKQCNNSDYIYLLEGLGPDPGGGKGGIDEKVPSEAVAVHGLMDIHLLPPRRLIAHGAVGSRPSARTTCTGTTIVSMYVCVLHDLEPEEQRSTAVQIDTDWMLIQL